MRNLFCCLLVMMPLLMEAETSKVKVHGHRGARSVLPENSLPAFEYAIQQGVDYLELDLAVTKDNVLVVSHDPHINKQICAGPFAGRLIRELTLAEVRQNDCGAMANPGYPKQKAVPQTKIPTLDEVLALKNKGTFGFNIETKIFPAQPTWTPTPDRFVALVLAAIKKHKIEDRVVLQSFDYRALTAMKKLNPKISLCALIGPPGKNWLEVASEFGIKQVAPYYKLVTPEAVAAAHEAGLEVIVWTPNEEAEWQSMLAAKVDAIITDDPAPLMRLLGRAKN
jgi:glycerophosphoryl diester phosphodiesterase